MEAPRKLIVRLLIIRPVPELNNRKPRGLEVRSYVNTRIINL